MTTGVDSRVTLGRGSYVALDVETGSDIAIHRQRQDGACGTHTRHVPQPLHQCFKESWLRGRAGIPHEWKVQLEREDVVGPEPRIDVFKAL